MDLCENVCRRCMYWELFIYECFLLIVVGYVIMLFLFLEGLLIGDDSIFIYVEVGFNCIISMFCILDDCFLDLWNF